ncbi:hypothetical protein DFJ73DRAFT_960646 [Zopfochytrium polystomum]|nr:hypothetical protein DFJ73DRAFT_960646 [Zopfochytrium polystomum]
MMKQVTPPPPPPSSLLQLLPALAALSRSATFAFPLSPGHPPASSSSSSSSALRSRSVNKGDQHQDDDVDDPEAILKSLLEQQLVLVEDGGVPLILQRPSVLDKVTTAAAARSAFFALVRKKMLLLQQQQQQGFPGATLSASDSVRSWSFTIPDAYGDDPMVFDVSFTVPDLEIRTVAVDEWCALCRKRTSAHAANKLERGACPNRSDYTDVGPKFHTPAPLLASHLARPTSRCHTLKLQNLSTSFNAPDQHNAAWIAAVFRTVRPKTTLPLSPQPVLENPGAARLLRLDLSANLLSDDDLALIIGAVADASSVPTSHRHALTLLDLAVSGNDTGPATCAALSCLLRASATLQRVSIDNPADALDASLDDPAARSAVLADLRAAITQCKTLVVLDADGWESADPAVLDALERNAAAARLRHAAAFACLRIARAVLAVVADVAETVHWRRELWARSREFEKDAAAEWAWPPAEVERRMFLVAVGVF